MKDGNGSPRDGSIPRAKIAKFAQKLAAESGHKGHATNEQILAQKRRILERRKRSIVMTVIPCSDMK